MDVIIAIAFAINTFFNVFLFCRLMTADANLEILRRRLVTVEREQRLHNLRLIDDETARKAHQ